MCRTCHNARKIQNWALYIISTAISHSRARNHEMPSIDEKWVMDKFELQKGRCYYTHVELDPTKIGTRSPYLPSLDRIDNKLGYTPENTQLTSLAWNQARNVRSIETTKEFFRKTSEYIERCKLSS